MNRPPEETPGTGTPDPDERVFWVGSPSADRLLMRVDYLLIPTGMLLGIAAFIGFFTAIRGVTSGTGSWLWVPLAVAGLWASWQMVIGHLIARRRRARSTTYVLSDGRIEEHRFSRSGRLRRRSQSLGAGVRLAVRPQYEGRATIRVGAVTLFNIEGATRVESLIRQQLPAASP